MIGCYKHMGPYIQGGVTIQCLRYIIAGVRMHKRFIINLLLAFVAVAVNAITLTLSGIMLRISSK